MINMKNQNKLVIRKLKKHFFSSFLAIVLIVGIGSGFYVTFRTIRMQYENCAEQYYKDYSLADYTVYGRGFDQADPETVKGITGVKEAYGRFSADFSSGENTLRVLSYNENMAINRLYIYEGGNQIKENECLLNEKYAEANALKLGDSIGISMKGKVYDFKIAALVSSPEYVYLAQSVSIPMADPHKFGIVYLKDTFFKNVLKESDNQIVAMFDHQADSKTLADAIKKSPISPKIENSILKEKQISYTSYEDDLTQINSFAFIFPVIFFMIGAMVIYVLQRRTIKNERKQIGIMKAIGLRDSKIMWMYTKSCVLIAIAGCALGYALSYGMSSMILSLFSSMFEIPGLAFRFFPSLLLYSLGITLLVCVVSNLIGIKSVMRIRPAEAMHAERPRRGKRILLERIQPIWHRLSFNTRYALKSSLRNKGRFFAVILGMTATVTLCVFSFGFNDSFSNLISTHYDHFIKYDISANLSGTPLNQNSKISALSGVKKCQTALLLPVNLENGTFTYDLNLLCADSNFDSMDLRTKDKDKIILGEGIILPVWVADQLHIQKGDFIKFSSPSDSFKEFSAQVTALSDQVSGFFAYTSFTFFEKVTNQASGFNTMFIQSNGNVNELKSQIEKIEGVTSVSTIGDDKQTLLDLLKTINTLIMVLIGFAVVLGIAVLYAVSIINLTTRNYEFNLLKVMGYTTKSIMHAIIKENILQMLLAIPLGFFMGFAVIGAVKGEFSSDSFMLIPHIDSVSYLYAALILIAVVSLIALFSIRFINKINVVEGIKERDE